MPRQLHQSIRSFDTNPVAAAFPRRDADPPIIDLGLSEVARGRVAVAANEGRLVPLGWVLEPQGETTTDAKAALAGSMLLLLGAVSSPKGAMLALVAELLVSAVVGASSASSFFVE